MKKKVVIDGAIFGLQKAGGISRMWGEILLGLDVEFARQHAVTVLIPTNRNIEWLRIAPHLHHIKVKKRRRFRWEKRSLFFESLYLMWVSLFLRPTIWHSSYYVGMPFLFGGKKFCFLYDMIPEILKFSKTYGEKVKYQTLRSTDHFFAISQHSLKDVSLLWPEFIEKGSVAYICSKEPFSVRAPKEQGPYFIHVGTRGGYKNFLVAAREILKDPRFREFELVVVGGEEKWLPEEIDEWNVSNAWERIKRFDILPGDEVENLMAGAAAVLFPSLYEGFGLPVLEAFQLGVPVLACRTSSIPEITGEEYPLADPSRSESYGDTLWMLLNEKENGPLMVTKDNNYFSVKN